MVWNSLLQELTTTTTVLVVTVTCLLLMVTSRLLPLQRVPGPWGLPIVGYYFFLKKHFHLQFNELAMKYGDVYRINIGGQEYVHLNTAKAIREAHINQSDNFESRGDNLMLKIGFQDGLVVMVGDEWRQHRKFFIQSMKDSGIEANKSQMKGPIEDAVQDTLQALKKARGKPIDLIALLTKPCIDAVVRLYLGNDISEEDITRINQTYLKLIEPMISKSIFLSGTIARYLILPWIKGYSQLLGAAQEIRILFKKVIENHKESFDPEQPPRDFIDRYLLEKCLREKKNDPSFKYFTDEALIGIVTQAYGDGSSSVAAFVSSFLYTISFHNDVQDELHEEIVRVVGTERLPTMDDKVNLPLTNSTIKELIRTSMFFPVSPGVQSKKSMQIHGVDVPKGCITLSNFWSANHDAKVYDNPMKFDAHRYHVAKSKLEQPLMFGIGKRSCAAENIVMAETFLYFTSVMQNFLLLPAEENVSIFDKIANFEKFDIIPVPRSRGRFSSATGNA